MRLPNDDVVDCADPDCTNKVILKKDPEAPRACVPCDGRFKLALVGGFPGRYDHATYLKFIMIHGTRKNGSSEIINECRRIYGEIARYETEVCHAAP